MLTAVLVIGPAAVAGVLPRLLRTAALVSAPLAISALLVNFFFTPNGATVLFEIGPITATAEGLRVALETAVRIGAISGALTLFYLTVPLGSLVVDLERRGVSPNATFVISSAVRTVPAILARTSDVTDAQRARGLDTEGSPWRRLRGLVPVVGPVLLGSIAEVEERSLALEARGVAWRGARTLLWWPADTGTERIARWLMALSLPATIAARAAGWLG